MFIRTVKKQRSKNAKSFMQFNLVQSVRINGKVKQKIILYLGSDPLLRDPDNRKIVLRMLKGKIFKQNDLFDYNAPRQLVELADALYQKYLVKYGDNADEKVSIPPPADKGDYQEVDVKNVQNYDVKEFGAENLCKQVLDKLSFKEILKPTSMTSEQIDKALIAITARAIYAKSEYKTAQILEDNSALKELYDYGEQITYKQLYSIADKLYEHKEQIDKALYERITNMFDIDDKLVIFDISNTYFETSKRESKIAKYVASKEKRYDCPIVVFTGVINSEGIIRHSRLYEGNKPDSGT